MDQPTGFWISMYKVYYTPERGDQGFGLLDFCYTPERGDQASWIFFIHRRGQPGVRPPGFSLWGVGFTACERRESFNNCGRRESFADLIFVA